MPSFKKPLLRISIAVVVMLGCAVAALATLYTVPRFRWRMDVLELKLTGGLQDLSWKELRQLNRHSDPFNLKELAKTPNPYAVIHNPYTSPQDVAAGEKLFQANCTVCHGAGGVGGGAGPSLRQRQMANGSSDWAIFKTISNGIAGTSMPPSSLPEDDRWRLLAYVRSIVRGPEAHEDTAAAANLAKIAPVTYEDILSAEKQPQRWLTYSGTYSGQRFSPIEQITPSNVSKLHMTWMRQYTTSENWIETSPLIVDGYMFVTVPPNRVEALDAKTGELIWHYDRELPQKLSLCCGYVNRGLGVLGHMLYFGTLDAHLVALDMRYGNVLWDVEIADHNKGYSITSAPLVIRNMVVTGVAGGEFGIRGFVTARDAASGKELWRFDSIPQPGQPGANSWEGESWKTGGGPTWLTGTYDPESNVIYWPTGNPSPNYNGLGRKGDDLYTNSVVALDADHGTLRWHFQFTPHDMYDFDATEILVSFDKEMAGKKEHFLAQANRNAFYYVLNRDNGQFLTATPFTKQNWANGVDAQGRPVPNPAAVPSPKGALVFPSNGGATNWMSPTYSPATGLFYVTGRNWGGNYFSRSDAFHSGETYIGGYFQLVTWPVQGTVSARDAATGKVKWEYTRTAYTMGGLLSTKGGIVFGSAEHFFFALDAETGKELWRIDTGGPIAAAPITYLVDGKQFVTLAAGHDLLTFGL